MIHRISLVAELIGWCVLIPGALLGLALAVGGFVLWLRGPEPVQLERRLGLVACDCGEPDCPALAGKPRAGSVPTARRSAG